MTASPQQTDPWTVLRLLQWTTDFFKRKGYDSPRLDAEVLLATALECKRIELYTSFDQQPPDSAREAFRELVRRRGEGVPVAYLVGHKEFYSLDFIVNEAVLIPRPETEHVVIEVLEIAKKRNLNAPRIADVGTGSGAIACAVAKHLPNAKIVALDSSREALDVAHRNIERLGFTDRISLVSSDLLGAIPGEDRFEIIASNPPYVSEAEYAQLSPEVRNHEPRGALVAGVTGTEVIERLLDQAAERLVPGGSLVVELSPMIVTQVLEKIAARAQFQAPRVIKDLASLARVISVATVA